jgi:hypothetical protein
MSARAYTNSEERAYELGRVYQSYTSADAGALRLALRSSPSQRVRPVGAMRATFQAVEGGPAFSATVLPDGYGVLEIPEREIARIVQAGLRHEIAHLYDQAQRSEQRAGECKTRGLRAYHLELAEEYRERAGQLEEQLAVPMREAV